MSYRARRFLNPRMKRVVRYFVDAANGNDSSSGRSPSLAWKTLDPKVNGETFDPGDHVLLKGLFREHLIVPSSGAAGKPITIGVYGSGAAISGADHVTGWTADGGSYSATVTTEPNIVIYDGTVLTENDGATNTVGVNEWDWNADELWINVGEDPDEGTAEAGARNSCISPTTESYIVIEGSRLYGGNSQGSGLVGFNGAVGGHDIVCRKVTMEKSAGFGVRAYHSSNNAILHCTLAQLYIGIQILISATGQTAANNLLTGNLIARCTGTGIDLWGFDEDERAVDNVLSYNIVSYCGTGIYLHRVDTTAVIGNLILDIDDDSGSNEGYGIGLQACSNNIVELNEIGRCWNRGIELWGGVAPDGPATANVLRYNEIYDNGDQAKLSGEAGGIFLSSSYVTAIEIYYNLIYGHNEFSSFIEHGIFGGGTGHKIFNNVLYDNVIGIRAWVADADDWDIQNNVMMNSSSRHIDLTTGVVVTACDYNLYYPNTGTLFRWAETMYNFADWKTQSSLDGNSPDPADPLFDDAANADFHIGSGSPGRNVGTDVSLTRDKDDVLVPQETNPALGAYEYVPV